MLRRAAFVEHARKEERRHGSGSPPLDVTPRYLQGCIAMHARMFEFEGSAEEIEAAIALARQEILPLERRMPGFRGLILLADRDARRLVSLSLWDSEEQMQESEASARMITRVAAQSVGGKRVAIEPFDVSVFEIEK